MKTGDLVVATRKGDVIFSASSGPDRYIGIFIKEDYGDKFVECFTGDRRGRFSPDFWDVEVVSENR
mgnify:CR=1 FL=1